MHVLLNKTHGPLYTLVLSLIMSRIIIADFLGVLSSVS